MNSGYTFDYTTRRLTNIETQCSFIVPDSIDVFELERENYFLDDGERVLPLGAGSFLEINLSDGGMQAYPLDAESFKFWEQYCRLKELGIQILADASLHEQYGIMLNDLIFSFYQRFFKSLILKFKTQLEETTETEKKQEQEEQESCIELMRQFILHLEILSRQNASSAIALMAIVVRIASDSIYAWGEYKRNLNKCDSLREKQSQDIKKLEEYFLIVERSWPENYKGGPDGAISEGYRQYEKTVKEKRVSLSTFRRLYWKWNHTHEAFERYKNSLR